MNKLKVKRAVKKTAHKKSTVKKVAKRKATKKVAKKVTRKVSKKIVPVKKPKAKKPVLAKEQLPTTTRNVKSVRPLVTEETGLTLAPVSAPAVSVSPVAVETPVVATVAPVAVEEKETPDYSRGDFSLFQRVRIREGQHKGEFAFIRAFVGKDQVALDFVGEGVPSGATWMNYSTSVLEKV